MACGAQRPLEHYDIGVLLRDGAGAHLEHVRLANALLQGVQDCAGADKQGSVSMAIFADGLNRNTLWVSATIDLEPADQSESGVCYPVRQ